MSLTPQKSSPPPGPQRAQVDALADAFSKAEQACREARHLNNSKAAKDMAEAQAASYGWTLVGKQNAVAAELASLPESSLLRAQATEQILAVLASQGDANIQLLVAEAEAQLQQGRQISAFGLDWAAAQIAKWKAERSAAKKAARKEPSVISVFASEKLTIERLERELSEARLEAARNLKAAEVLALKVKELQAAASK